MAFQGGGMNLRILGSAGAEFPDFRPPSFLIDGKLLLDAGTIGSVLNEEEQWGINNILITHSHLDHIRSIPALADNIIIKNIDHKVNLHSSADVITSLKDHLFNDIIWPDFSKIPSIENPVIEYSIIEPYCEYSIDGYMVKAIPVNHTVPTLGYRVTSGSSTLVYTGDTGTTQDIWKMCSGADVLIVEVSFPNSMESMAELTKHLTSSQLMCELEKIAILPKQILITHPKPQYYDIIRNEIDSLGVEGIELLRDGSVYDF